MMISMSDVLVVRRAEFSIEDPWAIPPQAEVVRLKRAADGAPPRLATTLAAYYDTSKLTLVFSGADDHVVATQYAHDAPLWEEDVVEAFLAPRDPAEYFEIEISPVGTSCDARIDSPDGIRETMRADFSWDCAGLFAGVRQQSESGGGMSLDVVMQIPFASLGAEMPKSGDTWRANFFRIDRHDRSGDEYTAWQPTLRTPADFHVAAAFGTLRFEG